MNSKEFITRRKNVFDLMEDDSVMIVFSNLKSEKKTEIQRNFYYLSGIIEEGEILLLFKKNQKLTEYIFIHPYDEFKAKWVGIPLSLEKVKLTSGIFAVQYLSEWEQTLYRILPECKYVYLDFNRQNPQDVLSEEEHFAKRVVEKNPWIQIKNANPLLAKVRTIKSPAEIEEIKKAIDITQKGIEAILTNIGPMKEYQLESYFDQAIKYHGASGYAFPTIAASGKNGCCLHYQDNNSDMMAGDLVLFDLGAHYNMYCADISRTFPVSGKFSLRQKEIYEIVLGGQEEVFKAAKPGVTTRELNQILLQYFAKELKRIGLIQEDKEVSKYYYHGVSHHIGLECHDLCEYIPLQAGSIISNEPGLYIAEENIGIRIEDDVLITETGCENLSKNIIKTVEEIEAFIAKGKEKKKMNEEILKKYAKLIVQMGVNVQKDQDVVISASVEDAYFVKHVVEEAYLAGAKEVTVDWSYQPITKLAYTYETAETLKFLPEWFLKKQEYRVEKLPAMIHIMSSDPDGLAGIDQEKLLEVQMATGPIMMKFREQKDNKFQWTIVGIPGEAWARKVFPELSTEKAMEALWDAILKVTRVNGDPIKNWKEHNANLANKTTKLNSLGIKTLTYKSANGTDFTIGIHPDMNFLAGGETTLSGVYYNPNMPTEECFTSPVKTSANGVVIATKPLSVKGVLVSDFGFRFEKGRVVEVLCENKEYKDILEKLISTDEGAAMLGEVALVPFDSPINQTNLLFYNTLYDENACCHLALGRAFTECIREYQHKSEAELKAVDLNVSMIHEDFMIGSSDLSIVAETFDGKIVQIFENGTWAI